MGWDGMRFTFDVGDDTLVVWLGDHVVERCTEGVEEDAAG